VGFHGPCVPVRCVYADGGTYASTEMSAGEGGGRSRRAGGEEGGGACDRRLDLVVCDLNQRANARAYVAAVPGAGRQAFHGNGGAARLPLTHPPRATAPCNFLHACRLPRDKFSVILSYFAPMSYVGRKAIK